MLSLIDKYRSYLNLAPTTPAVSLGEGNTPLVRLQNLDFIKRYQLTVYAKVEGANPTGSFKDRGMTVAVSQAVADGKRAILCASTGNTSASAAAYAARAGIQAFVLVPDGKIASGKLAQAIVHGAQVLQIAGNFDAAMQLVKQLTDKPGPIALVNSVNPYRLEGQKTAAFEIVDSLGRAPDYHCLPVGNAGNISAYWLGYTAYANAGKMTQLPKMFGYQAAGAAPFLVGQPIATPETLATAIRIGAPQSWKLATNAVQQSQGQFAGCTDEEIIAAQRQLASEEGIFCEPASAISLAGLQKDAIAGVIKPGSTIVCTLTGNGLKDPEIVFHNREITTIKVAADEAAIAAVLQQVLK